MTVRTNSYATYCVTCKKRMPENHGPLMRDGENRWVVSCDGSQGPNGELVEHEQPSSAVFVPSPYQAAIKAAIEGGRQHLAVGAVAGSGKTTTMAWLTRELQPILGRVLVLAFNKSIAEAIAPRVPSSVRVQTLNSFGASQLGYNLRARAQKPDDSKVRRIAVDLYPIENHPHEETHRKLMAPLVQLAKLERATLMGDPRRLAERYGVDLGEADLGLLWEAVPRVVEAALSSALNGYIDFDDQVLLPATQPGWRVEQFDTILLDEGQDANEAQTRLVLRAAGRDGRVIVVGDRFQAIYGFRGAGITSFDDIYASLRATERGAIELPLSVCYRCPQAAADLVNEEGLLIDESGKETEFLVREGAPAGVVDYTHVKQLAAQLKEEVAPFGGKVPDCALMILCPRNAPLVRPCLQLLVEGVKATIRGRDIGAEIVRLLLRVNPGSHLGGSGGKRGQRGEGQQDVGVMLKALASHCHKERAKLLKAEKEAAAEKISDQQMVIEAFAEEAETVSEVARKIENIFADTTDGVVFSTVHRAKGLEAKHVYLMEEWLMPWPFSKQSWERRQGLNLRYVALTRFQERLTFVFDDKHPLGPEDGEGDEEEADADAAFEAAREAYAEERGDAWEPPSEEEQAQMDADSMASELELQEQEEAENPHLYRDRSGEDTVPPAPAATFDGLSPAAEYDGAVLVDTLAKLPSLPSEGKGRGFVSPTLRDWQEISGLYLKAGCSVGISKPPRWVQHAFDVVLPGVKVRCSTTVVGFGETRGKGENAIDIVVVNAEGRPIDGQTRVLRTDAWQGRVCERVNALLRKHAKIGGAK